ncbi:MAG TPA: penicillin-binding protein 2 [Dongiaceae bacterium]|nr:penicillin-binding protein 2 [Dongiaceae bacterium]
MRRKQAEQLQAKAFTRRLLLLGGAQAAIVATIAGRLDFLQVHEADKYKLLADQNRINIRLLTPERGRILDRNGVPLADNRVNYRAMLIAEKSDDVLATLDEFDKIIPLDSHDRQRIERALSRAKSFDPVLIKDALDWEQVSAIELNIPNLPGVDIDIDRSRLYPYSATMAHVLGYVAAVAPAERNGDQLLEQPGFRIGKAGLEKTYDEPLRGEAGYSQLEVNSRGRIIRELGRTPAQKGEDLAMTIDCDLQQFAYQRMATELSASCAVMDIFTGDVLALASVPSYDPSAFYRGVTEDEWRTLINDVHRPLSNKCIAGQYAPGSTFKPMTALAALSTGIDPSFTALCTGSLELGNASFHCWKKEGHGEVDLRSAIKHSCDVYFYQLARKISIDPIAATARSFGLGSRTGLDLPGEKEGLIPDMAWKKATQGESWQGGETLVSAIGQGYILTTPLQLCVMMAQLANGGFKVVPRLGRPADGSIEPGAARTPLLGLEDRWLQAVLEGMDGVVNTPEGTAYRARIPIQGMEMGGKTGSAQVRHISAAERKSGVRKDETLPWNERDHALFIGFAPVGAPRYACAVVVEHGSHGASAAAPIARDLLIECQRRKIVSVA